jgi:aminoglycoside 6'-N-acetyltransferase I
MSGVTVRPARPVELATLVELATAFYTEDGFRTPVSELHDNLRVLLSSESARVTVADTDGTVVGFAITTLGFGLEQGVSAELEDLFVRTDHRRNGIASALIDDSVGWARSHGCRALELVVAPNGTNVDHLLGYYARRGFTDEGRRLLIRSLGP